MGDFDHSVVNQTAHRPWSMPDAPWIMTQTWHDLLFAHWPVDAAALREKVPAHFEVDLFDGRAWLAVVPFRMTNVSPRGIPSVPWVSEFPEVNVRTYVRAGERPGVYFFSLDAGSRLAVLAARTLLNLPYYAATMEVTAQDGAIAYQSTRDADTRARFSAVYRPAGKPFEPARGSLDYFLTERYCLYGLNHQGTPYRLEIHHPPWRLQTAAAEIAHNSMADAAGLPVPDVQPLLHFSKRQDMVAWAPQRIGNSQ